MKIALFTHGPLSVAIDASHKTFSFYSHGVYYEPKWLVNQFSTSDLYFNDIFLSVAIKSMNWIMPSWLLAMVQ